MCPAPKKYFAGCDAKERKGARRGRVRGMYNPTHKMIDILVTLDSRLDLVYCVPIRTTNNSRRKRGSRSQACTGEEFKTQDTYMEKEKEGRQAKKMKKNEFTFLFLLRPRDVTQYCNTKQEALASIKVKLFPTHSSMTCDFFFL